MPGFFVSLFVTCYWLTVEPFEITPPDGGQLSLHGHLIVGIGAGQHQLVRIYLAQLFFVAGYLHPPAVAQLALVEMDVDALLFRLHNKMFAVLGVEFGVVVFAVVEALDEIPDALSKHIGGLPVVVV